MGNVIDTHSTEQQLNFVNCFIDIWEATESSTVQKYLTDAFNTYCKDQNLPQISADELKAELLPKLETQPIKNYYIDYLNKDKGFKHDRKYFKSYEEAKKWVIENFEKWDTDMIQSQ